MFFPRFVLVLSAQSNLLRALLVTRESKIVAFAKQTFQIRSEESGAQTFDPAEVWYKMKKVIAACLDIGRTLSREIAGVVIVDETASRVVWYQEAGEIVSSGSIATSQNADSPLAVDRFMEGDSNLSGSLGTWFLWNLTGGIPGNKNGENSETRPRAPFDVEIPIVFDSDGDVKQGSRDEAQDSGGDAQILLAAERAWATLKE